MSRGFIPLPTIGLNPKLYTRIYIRDVEPCGIARDDAFSYGDPLVIASRVPTVTTPLDPRVYPSYHPSNTFYSPPTTTPEMGGLTP